MRATRLLLGLCSGIVLVSALTYDEVIQAPRRSSASPNSAGTLAAFTETAYSFATRTWRATLNKIELNSGAMSVVLGNAVDVDDFAWVDDSTVVYLNSSTAYTELWSVNIDTGATTKRYTYPGSVGTLKTHTSSAGVRVVVSAFAQPDGSIVSPDAPAPADSGLLYDSLFVRHWDYWLTSARRNVFGLLFSADLATVKEGLANYVRGMGIETPIMPFPSAGDFDLADKHIVVNAKAPELCGANNTATYFYVLEYNEDNTGVAPLNKRGFGACASPAFAPGGGKVAGLVQLENGYESDRNIVVVYELGGASGSVAVAEYTVTKPRDAFDRSPGSVTWAPDGSDVLYLMGEDVGKEVLWTVKFDAAGSGVPVKLATTHSVSNVEFIGGKTDKLLLSNNGIVKSTYFEVYNAKTNSSSLLLDAALAVKESQVGEFWFTGSREQAVHGFIVYPSNFDERKKYPLAFLIHGGPQSAWTDNWSTRWNPVVWADNGPDGYIVVTINPTGSTGYGKDFTDKIQNNWGSYPYIDLVLGLRYVIDMFEFVDTERMIAAGASYGGYMINWIQGSALGRAFKALVTHDGVFSTLNQYSSDELYFPTHDFGGTFMENTRGYYRYNPMNRMYHWATPHFIVHNAKDYRLPESEGLIAFNILQELGVPSKLLHFPDENHWVLKPDNSRRWHKEIFAFVNEFSAKTAAVEAAGKRNATRELVERLAEEVSGDIFFI
ncbi:Alpha/Beta hydrolase protein [Limtongia smithiae]|uniref:Alpha/Beta hydrolase protein n=1 Tax=Limtongia smithiae TaxID=1125753 RepID=UPI0034CE6CC1